MPGGSCAQTLSSPDDEAAKAARLASRERHKAKREQKAKRQHRIVEILLSGYAPADIARAVGATKSDVMRILASIFPFPTPWSAGGYVIMRLSPEDLATLGRLGKEVRSNRVDALEAIVAGALAEDAAIARGTLGVRSDEAT